MYATDNTTFISPIGIAFVLLMGVLILALPRRHALLPVVAMVCFMTMGQRLMVLNLNFTLIRILLVFGFLRVLLRDEVRSGPPNKVDQMMIWWVLASIISNTLLWGSTDAFVNRLGLAYDALGLYFLFRVLVRDADDMRGVLRQFAWLVAPLALSMLVEKGSGRNPFAMLGGVPPETLVREGVLRCQGPFAHPILAGAFGSALLPLFLGLWWQGKHRAEALLGLLSAGVIAGTAGSSGPLMAATAGLIGLALWPLRAHMRWVRWGLGLTLLGLHLAMAAPVWFLLARVGIFGGSTGYHRAILIDHAVRNFPSWWLVGTPTTANWGYYMFDVTNQYVLIGVQGGVFTLLLFLGVITRCFGSVGRAVQLRAAVQPVDPGLKQQVLQGQSWVDAKMAWALGASLMVHVMNYISVPYFDQNIVCWYLLLAMIATWPQLDNATQQAGADTVPLATPTPPTTRAPDWTRGERPAAEGLPPFSRAT
jgi:hypothetical protein